MFDVARVQVLGNLYGVTHLILEGLYESGRETVLDVPMPQLAVHAPAPRVQAGNKITKTLISF